jgi:hypothetical protein
MKMHRLFALAAAVFLVSPFLPNPALAQRSMATGGFVSGSQKVLNSIELPDGRSIRRLMFSVGVTADDPASPWHLGSQDCFATYMFAADGSLIGGRGVCDFVSPDGDIWWLTLEASGDDPVRWRSLGGTGKFAGIEHSGTTIINAEWSDGKVVGRWEGTMTRR